MSFEFLDDDFLPNLSQFESTEKQPLNVFIALDDVKSCFAECSQKIKEQRFVIRNLPVGQSKSIYSDNQVNKMKKRN
jgi:hypothetical protein